MKWLDGSLALRIGDGDIPESANPGAPGRLLHSGFDRGCVDLVDVAAVEDAVEQVA